MNTLNKRHFKKTILCRNFVEKIINKDSRDIQSYPISAWLALTQGH